MSQIYNSLTGLPARGWQQHAKEGWIIPPQSHLFPSCLWIGKAVERAELGDQPVWEFFLTNWYKWIIHLTWKIIQLLSGYRAEIRSSGEGQTSGKRRQNDSCRCGQVVPLSTTCSSELILPEVPASLVRMKAVPSSAGSPGYGRRTGLQLGSCYWRGCHHCHVTLGTAAGLSRWSLDHCVKGSSVTALGPKKLPMPDMDRDLVFLWQQPVERKRKHRCVSLSVTNWALPAWIADVNVDLTASPRI